MYQRDTLMRIVALAMLVYGLVSFSAVAKSVAELEENAAKIKAKTAELAMENAVLEQHLQEGGSDEELISMARTRLGLVLPGEKVFYFLTDRED